MASVCLPDQLAHVLAAVPDAVLVVDITGRIVWANQRAEALFGYPRHVLVDMDVHELVPAARRGSHRGQLKSFFAAPAGRLMDGLRGVDARTADGARTEIEVSLSRIDLGATTYALAFARDVSARRAAERELRDQTEVLERVFAATQTAIAYLDRDLRFVRVNDAYASTTAHARDYFPGKKHFDLYPHEENEQLFRSVIETGRAVSESAKSFEHPDQLERGTTYWDWTLVPVRGADNTVDGALLCLLDVTERVCAETERRANEARFRLLLDDLPDGVCVVRNEHIVYANRALAQLVAGTAEGLRGKRLTDIIATDSAGDRDLVVHISDTTYREATLATFTGESRRVAVRSRLIDFEAEAAVLHVLRDIEERQRLEEELRHAQKLEVVGRLVAGVAHDFNNLLTVISTNVHLNRLAQASGLALGDPLAEIDHAVERATRLTRQLLSYSQRQPRSGRPVDVAGAVRETARLLACLLPEDIALEMHVEPAGTAAVEPAELEMALMNLVVNARDAMPEGGRIDIETRRALGADGSAEVSVLVRDSGPGMDAAVRARVFEPFFTTKRDGKGTGLGLSTVRSIAENAGGRVTVSGGPGEGAVFELRFPSMGDSPTEVVPGTDSAAPCGTETVLLVEDERSIRSSVQRALEAYGYRVLSTDDVDGARTLFAAHGGEIALLVTDVVLRRSNGVALCGELRRQRAGLPVLFMSGYPTDELGERGWRVDIERTRLLAKPLRVTDLMTVVRQLIDVG